MTGKVVRVSFDIPFFEAQLTGCAIKFISVGLTRVCLCITVFGTLKYVEIANPENKSSKAIPPSRRLSAVSPAQVSLRNRATGAPYMIGNVRSSSAGQHQTSLIPADMLQTVSNRAPTTEEAIRKTVRDLLRELLTHR